MEITKRLIEKHLKQKDNKLYRDLIRKLEVNTIPYKKHIIQKKSAVLILLFPDKDQDLYTIIIKRTQDNSPHSGQIGLPGGRKDLTDLNLKKTAIREVKEELGIKQKIEILARLNKIYIPVSNFQVQPFVGWLNNKPLITRNKDEVKEYYFLPIRSLVKKLENITTHKVDVRGKLLNVPGFFCQGVFVWGATAKILADFVTKIKPLFKQ